MPGTQEQLAADDDPEEELEFAGQSVHFEAPSLEYVFRPHNLQTDSEVAPSIFENLPALHCEHTITDEAASWIPYVPWGQRTH